jgi:hypothetical protein
MDQAYWLNRERDAILNARAATFADVQLIHYGLAHRYSIEAENAAKAVRGRPKPKRAIDDQLRTAFRPTLAQPSDVYWSTRDPAGFHIEVVERACQPQ